MNKRYQKTNYSGGQTVLLVVIIVLTLAMLMIARVSGDILGLSRIVNLHNTSQQAATLAESGIEDVSYRIKEGLQYDEEERLTIDGEEAVSTTVVDELTGITDILSRAEIEDVVRKKGLLFVQGIPANMLFAIQSGGGGRSTFSGNVAISGNVHADDEVDSSNSVDIDGDVTVSGDSGSADGVNATGDVKATSITGSIVGGDAYYDDNISSTMVTGNSLEGQAAEEELELPFDADQIYQLQVAIANNASTYFGPCPYVVTGIETIGNFLINCDLEISGNAQVTFDGPVWVKGNITVSDNSVIDVDANLTTRSVPIFAYDPLDVNGKGKITLNGSVELRNSGQEGSYVVFYSGNIADAITVNDSVNGEVILYAPLGTVAAYNDVIVRGLYGKIVVVSGSVQVNYSSYMRNVILDAYETFPWQVSLWREVE